MQILRLNTWAHILTPPLPSCVTLDKILNSPVFPLSTTEYDSNSTSPIRLWGRLNKIKHIKGSDGLYVNAQQTSSIIIANCTYSFNHHHTEEFSFDVVKFINLPRGGGVILCLVNAHLLYLKLIKYFPKSHTFMRFGVGILYRI